MDVVEGPFASSCHDTSVRVICTDDSICAKLRPQSGAELGDVDLHNEADSLLRINAGGMECLNNMYVCVCVDMLMITQTFHIQTIEVQIMLKE